MPAKQLIFEEAARQKILRGIELLSRAVKATLGPKGRNVVIDKKYGSPTVTKDGVTVAKEVELPDPYENMGAQMVKEVASKTSDTAGDGTTTATVLAEAIYKEGLKNVTAGSNPIYLKRGIDRAVEAVVGELAKISKKVSDREEIRQVAAVSANWDFEIADKIADAMDKVGKDGTITVEEAKSIETTLEVVEGMQFDKGYLSPYFVTNAESMEAVLEDAYVLIHEKKITVLNDLLPLLATVCNSGSRSRAASRCSSSPRKSRARRSLRSSSTRSAACSTSAPSRPPASATAARPCSRTLPSSPAAAASPRTSASSLRTSRSATLARPSASPSTRRTPPWFRVGASRPTSRAA